MDTFPKDGTRCDILFEGSPPVIAKEIHWGLPPIGKQLTFIGSNNILSPWLVENREMLGWRLHQKGQ